MIGFLLPFEHNRRGDCTRGGGNVECHGSLCLLFAVLPLRQHLPRLRQRKGCEFCLPGFPLAKARRRGGRGTAIALRSTRSVPPAAEPLRRVKLFLQASASPARMARTSSAAAARSARHAHRAAASARERTSSSPSQGIGKRSGAGPDKTHGTLRLSSAQTPPTVHALLKNTFVRQA